LPGPELLPALLAGWRASVLVAPDDRRLAGLGVVVRGALLRDHRGGARHLTRTQVPTPPDRP
jgi:hypothetical protein